MPSRKKQKKNLKEQNNDSNIKIRKPRQKKNQKDKRQIWQCSKFNARRTNLEEIHISNFNNPHTFYYLMSQTDAKLLEWLQREQLIATTVKCTLCTEEICGTMKLCKRSECQFQCSFRCDKNRNHEKTVFLHSFFYRIQHPIQDQMTFIYSLLTEMNLSYCAKNSGVTYQNTAVLWATQIRDLFKQWCYTHIIEGELVFDSDVQIDESFFGTKVQY